jgi:hypothetical protein
MGAGIGSSGDNPDFPVIELTDNSSIPIPTEITIPASDFTSLINAIEQEENKTDYDLTIWYLGYIPIPNEYSDNVITEEPYFLSDHNFLYQDAEGKILLKLAIRDKQVVKVTVRIFLKTENGYMQYPAEKEYAFEQEQEENGRILLNDYYNHRLHLQILPYPGNYRFLIVQVIEVHVNPTNNYLISSKSKTLLFPMPNIEITPEVANKPNRRSNIGRAVSEEWRRKNIDKGVISTLNLWGYLARDDSDN